MKNGNPSPIRVLLVDDDPGDIRLTLEALKESKIHANFDVVGDGEEALAFLRREGNFSGALPPDLILLDLNMPRKDGRETLKEIKRDPNLKRIPVVILTTSRDDRDIIQTYDLGASCYVPKPVGIDEFTTVVKAIEDFWFAVVRLSPE